MKKGGVIFFAIFLLGVQLKAQDGLSVSRWQNDKINVDGNNDEWEKPLNLYDDKTGLLFAVANDRKNLYLCFTGKDDLKIKKMMHAGWTLQVISREKKKKFDASIAFPAIHLLMPEKKGNEMIDAAKQKTGFSDQVNVYKIQFSQVTAKGFVTRNGLVSLNDSLGINIGIGSDRVQKIIYEISIPINELLADAGSLSDLPIELKVSVNPLERPGGQGGQRNRGGGEMGHGGGMGRGGMGREGLGRSGMGDEGMGRGRRGGENNEDIGEQPAGFDRNTLFEKASFSQKLKLTIK